MKDFDVNEHLAEALSMADERDLPRLLMDEWEPMECLGKSELSETLLMRNRKDGRKAVAKLLQAGQPETELFYTLKKLNHAGIPGIIELYPEAERTCILREYIEGQSIADLGAGKRFTYEETIKMGLQLCEVLSFLHGQNPPIIHRDVKPENVILKTDGSPVLIDFGIARLQSDTAENDTRVMGTQSFAPPEQYGFHQTDCRSDVYALGVLLGWMITGSVKKDAYPSIQNKEFVKILDRATSFAPENRYGSAGDMKKALQKLQTSQGKKHRSMGVLAASLLVAAAAATGFFCWRGKPAEVVFAEPLIEADVRKILGVSEGEKLSAEMLASVEGLYIFGDAAAQNQDGFYEAAGNWYSSGSKAHGPITTLEDVKWLPNLQYVMVAAQHITDLSPLAELQKLEKVEFKHNSISDITSLKNLTQLASVGLNDNPMTDISTLATLQNLRFLDLCDASFYEAAVMEEMGDFEFLDISNRTDSWKYLAGRSVKDLRLGWTEIDGLDVLADVSGLEKLELQHTKITDLQGIEIHEELRELRLSGCEISSLQPLLLLPNLQRVTLSSDMEAMADELGETAFEILYEE